MSLLVTVPSKVGLVPGPAIGGPCVRSGRHRVASHAAPIGFAPSLHAKSAPLMAWSWSEVSRYSEQPLYTPEPTTSTLPYLVDVAETVAGPVGPVVIGSAHELVAACATAVDRRATTAKPRTSAAIAKPTMGLAIGRNGDGMSPPLRRDLTHATVGPARSPHIGGPAQLWRTAYLDLFVRIRASSRSVSVGFAASKC